MDAVIRNEGVGEGARRPVGRAERFGVAGLAAASALVTIAATWQGVGITADGALYMSAADSLASDRRLITYDGQRLTDFPPGYSVLLRVVMVVAGSVDDAARLVGVAAAALLVVLTWSIASRLGAGRGWALTAAAVVASSPAVAVVTRGALSEPPFAVAVLAIALLLARLGPGVRVPSWTMLAALVALTWAAVGFRYLGVGLVPGVALALVVLGGRSRASLMRSGASVMVAAGAPAIIVLANRLAAGRLGGPSFLARTRFANDFSKTFRTVAEWLSPALRLSVREGRLVGAVVVLVLVVGATRCARDGDRRPAALLALVGGAVVFLLASARIAWASPGTRMLMPFLGVGAAVGVLVAEQACGRLQGRTVARFAVYGVFVFALVSASVSTLRQTSSVARVGEWYTSDTWRDSPIIAAVDALPPDAIVFSSAPDAVWAQTRRVPTYISPRLVGIPGEVRRADVARFAAAACPGAYLAWVYYVRSYLARPNQLELVADLEVVARYPDGALYRVTRSDC
jgi:hypothetical protein